MGKNAECLKYLEENLENGVQLIVLLKVRKRLTRVCRTGGHDGKYVMPPNTTNNLKYNY